jgi:hypothetical protein
MHRQPNAARDHEDTYDGVSVRSGDGAVRIVLEPFNRQSSIVNPVTPRPA